MDQKHRRPPEERGFSRGRGFFEQLVREAVECLPPEVKGHMENVAILVEEEFIPGSPDEGDEGEEEREFLGFYHGIPQKDRGFWYGNVLPDRIIIYRKPLERISRNLEELKENVRQTVIHEVGHYFGLSEEELAELEGRGR
jgi:predicted Zn-dependent protease with MMP-like domain